ncbi:O-antigen ligase family protein [Patescibacteria group bacterium]|nr:O-antigen ligase family protein [Patescibacteria group bacterium]
MNIFIVLILLYIIISLLALNYPQLIVPILLILSPLERFNIYVGLTVDPITMFIPVIILSLLINYQDIISFAKNINKRLLYSLTAIIIAIFITDIFSINKFLSIKATFYILLSVLILLTTYIYTCKYKNIKQILIFAFISALIVSTYGIFQFFGYLFFHFDTFNLHRYLYSTTINPNAFIIQIKNLLILRPNSTFNDVNTSAGFILLFIPTIILIYFSKIKYKHLKLIKILSIPILFYFITTLSKSALIGLLFTSIFIAIYYYKKFNIKKYLYIVGIMFFIIIIGIIILYPYLYKLQNYSINGHLLLVKYSFLSFLDHPLFGIGLGTFSYYFGNYIKPFIPFYYNNIDNPPLYLLWLSELGIIGFISYIYFIYTYIKIYIKNIGSMLKDNNNIYFIISMGFLSGVISVLIANLFHSYFSLFFNWVFLGTFLGITKVLYNTKKIQEK